MEKELWELVAKWREIGSDPEVQIQTRNLHAELADELEAALAEKPAEQPDVFDFMGLKYAKAVAATVKALEPMAEPFRSGGMTALEELHLRLIGKHFDVESLLTGEAEKMPPHDNEKYLKAAVRAIDASYEPPAASGAHVKAALDSLDKSVANLERVVLGKPPAAPPVPQAESDMERAQFKNIVVAEAQMASADGQWATHTNRIMYAFDKVEAAIRREAERVALEKAAAKLEFNSGLFVNVARIKHYREAAEDVRKLAQ